MGQISEDLQTHLTGFVGDPLSEETLDAIKEAALQAQVDLAVKYIKDHAFYQNREEFNLIEAWLEGRDLNSVVVTLSQGPTSSGFGYDPWPMVPMPITVMLTLFLQVLKARGDYPKTVVEELNI